MSDGRDLLYHLGYAYAYNNVALPFTPMNHEAAFLGFADGCGDREQTSWPTADFDLGRVHQRGKGTMVTEYANPFTGDPETELGKSRSKVYVLGVHTGGEEVWEHTAGAGVTWQPVRPTP
jgi:hypothetical protein